MGAFWVTSHGTVSESTDWLVSGTTDGSRNGGPSPTSHTHTHTMAAPLRGGSCVAWTWLLGVDVPGGFDAFPCTSRNCQAAYQILDLKALCKQNVGKVTE